LSLTSHLLILLALLWTWPEARQAADQAAVTVALLSPPNPPAREVAKKAPAAPARSRPEKQRPRRVVVKPSPPDIIPVPAQVAQKPDAGATLTEAQLAGAATAGSGDVGGAGGGEGGGAGGACDMAARVQAALRRDALVRAAIARSDGKATLIWNGDWVRSLGEDGKGLATIREAILWEVGFAPAACREQPVRGLVLLSLGGARVALGSGHWRWSDLLTPHPGARDED
jgi:hypothetical protein